jgi:uncharacterized protein YggE
MRIACLTALVLTGASLALGQLDTDTITIQASRSVNLTPDQVGFLVSVSASPNTSLDQIVAALSGTGITASNLSSMYGAMDNQSSLQWSFTLAAPSNKMNATIALLIALQQSIAKNNSGMSLMFQLQGPQISPEAFQSQACSMKDLIADAQAQAQNVAAAAGLAVGPIIAISDGSSSTTAVPTFAARLGDFSIGQWFNPTPSGCSLAVKFKLLRYQ